MRLVNPLDQMFANVSMVETARTGGAPAGAAAYAALIKRGTCFLPYATPEGLAFAPSRFIGYASNSFIKHAANDARDGRQTNSALSELLEHAPIQDRTLEAEYKRFCLRLGFVPLLTGTFFTHDIVERDLASVPEWRMSQVVRRADRLDQREVGDPRRSRMIEKVLLQLAGNTARDLSYLDRMRKPVAVEVAVAKVQDLSLAL